MTKQTEDHVRQMMENGIVTIFGYISQEMPEQVQYAITRLFLMKKKKVFVIISSEGGMIKPALEIFDTLRLYPGQINGIVVGKAMSSAAIILQACGTRTATPNSKILVHNGNINLNINILLNSKILREEVKKQRCFMRRIWNIVASRSGRSMKEVEIEFERDEEMGVEQAIKFGLVDKVFDKPLPWNIAEELKS